MRFEAFVRQLGFGDRNFIVSGDQNSYSNFRVYSQIAPARFRWLQIRAALYQMARRSIAGCHRGSGSANIQRERHVLQARGSNAHHRSVCERRATQSPERIRLFLSRSATTRRFRATADKNRGKHRAVWDSSEWRLGSSSRWRHRLWPGNSLLHRCASSRGNKLHTPVPS